MAQRLIQSSHCARENSEERDKRERERGYTQRQRERGNQQQGEIKKLVSRAVHDIIDSYTNASSYTHMDTHTNTTRNTTIYRRGISMRLYSSATMTQKSQTTRNWLVGCIIVRMRRSPVVGIY